MGGGGTKAVRQPVCTLERKEKRRTEMAAGTNTQAAKKGGNGQNTGNIYMPSVGTWMYSQRTTQGRREMGACPRPLGTYQRHGAYTLPADRSNQTRRVTEQGVAAARPGRPFQVLAFPKPMVFWCLGATNLDDACELVDWLLMTRLGSPPPIRGPPVVQERRCSGGDSRRHWRRRPVSGREAGRGPNASLPLWARDDTGYLYITCLA